MAEPVPFKSKSCMEVAKEQLEKSRRMYGPSNSELLKEITELKKMVADLKILVMTKPH